MSLLVQIGREIIPLIKQNGILCTQLGENEQHQKEYPTEFDAGIHIINKFLRLQSSETDYAKADDPKVAKAVMEQIIALSKIDDSSQIRIIKGAFVDSLSDNLMLRFMLLRDQKPEIFNRIVLTYFNMQTQEFYDRKLTDVLNEVEQETRTLLQ